MHFGGHRYMPVLLGVGVAPQVIKLEQVSNDDYQIYVSSKGGGRSPGLMSGGRVRGLGPQV